MAALQGIHMVIPFIYDLAHVANPWSLKSLSQPRPSPQVAFFVLQHLEGAGSSSSCRLHACFPAPYIHITNRGADNTASLRVYVR